MWDRRVIVESLAQGLRAEQEYLDAEQSVRGVDALDELALHRLLLRGLVDAGLGALSEQRFPAVAGRRRRSEGARCDIVVTEAPGGALVDPLQSDTLFAGEGVDPGEAFWIEVKIAAQHAVIEGVGRPNPRYSAQLLTGVVRDVRRLAAESGIAHGAACAVVFIEDAAIAEHDVAACAHRCLDKGLTISAPVTESFPITDRIGNGLCCVALFPVG